MTVTLAMPLSYPIYSISAMANKFLLDLSRILKRLERLIRAAIHVPLEVRRRKL